MKTVGRSVTPWWWRNPRAHLAVASTVLIVVVLTGLGYWYENRPIGENEAFQAATSAMQTRYQAASSGKRSDWEALHSVLTDQAIQTLEHLPTSEMAPLPIAYHPMKLTLVQSSPGTAVIEADGSLDVSMPGEVKHTDMVRELVVLKREGTAIKVAAWDFIGPPPRELRLLDPAAEAA